MIKTSDKDLSAYPLSYRYFLSLNSIKPKKKALLFFYKKAFQNYRNFCAKILTPSTIALCSKGAIRA